MSAIPIRRLGGAAEVEKRPNIAVKEVEGVLRAEGTSVAPGHGWVVLME